MAKKCPPGMICLENITIFIIIIVFVLLGLYIYQIANKTNTLNSSYQTNTKYYAPSHPPPQLNNQCGVNIPYSNNDVLLNPYTPPLKDERYSNCDVKNGMPINIPTQGVETNYRQIGILTKVTNDNTILPLMGKPLITNRDKWNYYCMNDKNNLIKLSVKSKGKSCMSEYGCDSLYHDDIVYIDGYNDAFKVTLYENNTIRYIPY